MKTLLYQYPIPAIPNREAKNLRIIYGIYKQNIKRLNIKIKYRG